MTDISITVVIVILFLILLIFILTGLLYMKLQADNKKSIDNSNDNTNNTIISYQPYPNDVIYYNRPFWNRPLWWRRPHRFLRY